MFEITETLRDFIQGDQVVVVGTRDENMVPDITGGWAPRVIGTNELELFIDTPRSERALENLRSNGRIAVTFGNPIDYRALQLKGWCISIGETGPEDEARLESHRQNVTEALRARGEPAYVTRNYWSEKTTRLRVQVEEAFDQTPGPGAGGKL